MVMQVLAIKKEKYSNETCMSLPLTNRSEQAHASFIAVKNNYIQMKPS
jgi:hypothetical protein